MMPQERASIWRMDLWRYMLDHLPARVIINLDVGYYSVIDNSDQYIYADDLDEDIYDEIVREWGSLLHPRDEETFYGAFRLDNVNERRRIGRQKINLLVGRMPSSRARSPLHVRLVFQRQNNESEMEFQFFQQQ